MQSSTPYVALGVHGFTPTLASIPPERGVGKDNSKLKSPLVLCVDDDPGVREFYGSLLVEEGYNVISAGTGAQALTLVQSRKDTVDAAILDYKLPGMNGFELAVRLKQHDPLLPILMISSAFPDPEDMLPFVDTALTKGVPVGEILEGIQLLLASRRQRQNRKC
jgi:CheY-like chemotaxis protein